MTFTLLFWILLILLIYTYLGYAIILFALVQLKKLLFTGKNKVPQANFEPNVCLFVTAFNEKDFLRQKVENSFSLDYPKEKIQYLWITDGSDDGTPELLKAWPQLEIHHQPERQGKMHAMNRGVKFVKAPFIIFSDTNTLLGNQSIREIVTRFGNPEVGCVAGEKRIINSKTEAAAGAGEGLYWKYESWIKKMDAELNSAVGAVGELFAIRTELFEDVETDTLLDDFLISLRIAQKGFKIDYAPNAFAEETACLNVKEELKRKVRISAGGVQTIFRLKGLLNPFKNGILTWQYLSHKVLRWTIAPISLFMLLPVNLLVVMQMRDHSANRFYHYFLWFQLVMYVMALIGWYFENRKLHFKLLFIPYYFVVINFTSIRGMMRYFKGKQSVAWEKSKRAV